MTSLITPGQCREARALLRWSVVRLEAFAGVPADVIWDFEAGRRAPREERLAALRRALEEAGVEFLRADGDGQAVRRRGG